MHIEISLGGFRRQRGGLEGPRRLIVLVEGADDFYDRISFRERAVPIVERGVERGRGGDEQGPRRPLRSALFWEVEGVTSRSWPQRPLRSALLWRLRELRNCYNTMIEGPTFLYYYLVVLRVLTVSDKWAVLTLVVLMSGLLICPKLLPSPPPTPTRVC